MATAALSYTSPTAVPAVSLNHRRCRPGRAPCWVSNADLQSLDVAVCWHAKDNVAACDYQAAHVGFRSSQPTRNFIAHVLHTGRHGSSCLLARGKLCRDFKKAALRPPWLIVFLLLVETGAPCRYLRALTRPGLA